MKTLFALWPKYHFNLQVLEGLLARLSEVFQRATENIGLDVSKLNAAGFNPVKAATTLEAEKVKRELSDSTLFAELYSDTYDRYLARPGIGHAKKLFSLTPIEGLLAAYRLFYVGCSRARSDLSVIIPTDVLDGNAASEAKLEELGFDVSYR